MPLKYYFVFFIKIICHTLHIYGILVKKYTIHITPYLLNNACYDNIKVQYYTGIIKQAKFCFEKLNFSLNSLSTLCIINFQNQDNKM